MRRSLGIMSGAFALRSHAFALVGRLFFSFFYCHFGNQLAIHKRLSD
jgi:hypothetical protein